MVYRWYIYSWWAYKSIYNWGGHHLAWIKPQDVINSLSRFRRSVLNSVRPVPTCAVDPCVAAWEQFGAVVLPKGPRCSHHHRPSMTKMDESTKHWEKDIHDLDKEKNINLDERFVYLLWVDQPENTTRHAQELHDKKNDSKGKNRGDSWRDFINTIWNGFRKIEVPQQFSTNFWDVP